MFWLQKVVDEIEKAHPEGEVVVSSGVSPSGKYHVGTLREVLTTDALVIELKKRGRDVRHVHFVDDLDFLRKVPAGIDESFEKYLGQSLCDVPSPDGSPKSYADYFLDDFLGNLDILGIKMEVVRAHEKYRSGFFETAIEKTLTNLSEVKTCLEEVSGRKLDDQWSPVQINEDGYLKKRAFISIDTSKKTINYVDKNGQPAETSYLAGQVKLDWRLDWPARWWLVGVHAEPFGRDHAAKGGSYDTGVELVKRVFGAEPPYPLPYEFINRTGETKKMSKSAGNTVNISELLSILPPEIVRYFVLRFSPDKTLFFDQEGGIVRLIDEYAELLAKPEKNADDEQLIHICTATIEKNTISNVPFSHLVASYQAALKDPAKTIQIIKRTEHADVATDQEQTINLELRYIDKWLEEWAPESVKFSLKNDVNPNEFNDEEKKFLKNLAEKIESAPRDADGEWFHQAIYSFKTDDISPKQLFTVIYRCLIGKEAGPRAGWFLRILPRDWLISRLNLTE
jgi:lysyl-tRNA synthetase, class I